MKTFEASGFGRTMTLALAGMVFAGMSAMAEGPAVIAVDSSGNAYLTGSWVNSSTQNVDFATVRYDSNGKLVWANKSSSHMPYGASYLAVNGQTGNVYTTSTVLAEKPKSDYDSDFLTVKYDSSGKQLWQRRYNGPAKSYDTPTGIALDSMGNPYVTGDTATKNNEKKQIYKYEFTTVKFDALSGKQKWAKRYAGPATGKQISNRPCGIAVDSFGNIYVTGDSQAKAPKGSTTTTYDFATIKYTSKGARPWVKRYSGPAAGYNIPTNVGVDNAGNSYVTGTYYPESSGNNLLQTVAYQYSTVKKQDGAQKWVKTYDLGSGNAVGMGVAPSGNVYVLTRQTDTQGTGFVTIKYDSAGNQTAVYRYPETGSGEPRAIAVDSTGNAYLTGQTNGAMTTVKYDSRGNLLIFTGDTVPGTSNALTVDNMSGATYVTGTTSSNQFATIKYDSSGKQTWVQYYAP